MIRSLKQLVGGVGLALAIGCAATPAAAQTVTLNFSTGVEVDPGRKYSESGYDVAHPDYRLHRSGGRLQLHPVSGAHSHPPAESHDSSGTDFLKSLGNLGEFSFRSLNYFAADAFQFRLRAIDHDESVLDEQVISGSSDGSFTLADIPLPLRERWECLTRVEVRLDSGTVELDDVTLENCETPPGPAVPEPASLALFLPAAAVVLIRRRRR